MSRYWAEIENKMDKIRLVQIWSGSGLQQVVSKVEQGDTWGGAEVPPAKEMGQSDNKRKKARTRKEEYRRKAELRRKENKEKAAEKEKKKKEREEALRKKGEKMTKNQLKISVWFRKKDAEQRGQPVGGRKGVG